MSAAWWRRIPVGARWRRGVPVGGRWRRPVAAGAATVLAALTLVFIAPPARAAAGEPACMAEATTPFPDLPWAQVRLAPERAWTLSRGDGEVVAVIDTGVSALAPALQARVLPGRDVRTDGRADTDCSGHGTFMAGLIAAARMPGTGFAGVAPGAQILPIRVTDRFDDVHPDVLAEGIEAAIDGGASIIVVVPAAPYGSDALTSAVDRAERENRLVIAPATTQRSNGEATAYPAALDTVLSVAAIGRDGRPMLGAGAAAGASPDIAAPGADLVGIGPTGTGNIAGSARCFATGFVAGAAALARGYLGDLTPAELRFRLTATADPAPPSARPTLGAGVVDPMAAVTAVDPMPPPDAGSEVVGPDMRAPAAYGPTHDRGMDVAAAWVGAATGGGIVTAMAVVAIAAARRRRAAAAQPPAAPDA